MKHNSKLMLLATLIACLVVATVLAGCGGYSVSYIAGVYSGPSSAPKSSGVTTPIHGMILQLNDNSTYFQTTYIPNPRSKTTPNESESPLVQKNYSGTFIIKDKQVILHGEPPEAYGTFKIVGINLKNHWGLWISHGAEWK